MRKPKDRDFIETVDGLIFCVVGYLHPPGASMAYLKYAPSPKGRWQRESTAYQRMLAYYHAHQVGQTLEYLSAHFPQYVCSDPKADLTFSFVPEEWVKTYFCPEQGLQRIIADPCDSLEEEAAGIAISIQGATSIPLAAMGVTGSILLGAHDPSFSDINLVVYGREYGRRLRTALQQGAVPELSRISPGYADQWRQRVMKNFGLDRTSAGWLVDQRWNFGTHLSNGRLVTFHPGRQDEEITEPYGAHVYRDIGWGRLTALVTGTQEAIFVPSLYAIERAQILAGPQVAVNQICSYEGHFMDLVDVGQIVEACGKLEQVDGGPWHRLVIGSSHRDGLEYLLPAPP